MMGAAVSRGPHRTTGRPAQTFALASFAIHHE
jgi:hypothetical protein